MRGDQLGRQWRTIRAIEASPNGLTVTEIAQREETGIRTIYGDLDALQAAGFSLYSERADRTNRWAFMDAFKFKIPPPFILSDFISIYSYKDLARKALVEPLSQYSVIWRAFDLTGESRLSDLVHL
jgi:hypothetical protein